MNMYSNRLLLTKWKNNSKYLNCYKGDFLVVIGRETKVKNCLQFHQSSVTCKEDCSSVKQLNKFKSGTNYERIVSSFQRAISQLRSATSDDCKCNVPRVSKFSKLNSVLDTVVRNRYKTLAAIPLALDSSAGRKLDEAEKLVDPKAVSVEDVIPEPPLPVSDTLSTEISNALGEPSFVSLGLGGNSPIGWVQSCFEYVHVTLGVPWWETILIGTLIIRFCMFPLVIIAQRNAAKMNNVMPQMQVIQLKMTEARQSGNQLDVARYSQEMVMFMREKQINPLKNMIVPLFQMPVFVSFFIGLRQMCNLPVESLKEGGLWWFVDLTVPDQYFLMPIITSTTLWATIELGTDSAKLSAQNLQTMKYVLRAMPICILPFTANFPGAILLYWTLSNFISLMQVGFLKIPAVRSYFKIEAAIPFKPEDLPVKTKGFTEGIKDSWTNLKIAKEFEDRQHADRMRFRQAGQGPLVKTYKHNPTKKQSNAASISAKTR